MLFNILRLCIDCELLCKKWRKRATLCNLYLFDFGLKLYDKRVISTKNQHLISTADMTK